MPGTGQSLPTSGHGERRVSRPNALLHTIEIDTTFPITPVCVRTSRRGLREGEAQRSGQVLNPDLKPTATVKTAG